VIETSFEPRSVATGRTPDGCRRTFAHRTGSSPRSLAVHLILLLLGLGVAACSRPIPDRVVLVTIDTLRADHVGSYGNPSARTATLDGLARDGIRFEAAFSPAPLTLPTHASIMTALDPPRHGVRHNSIFALGPEHPTLAERMKASGRATAAFVGALVLHSRFGLGRGFDVYDDRVSDRSSGLVGYAERTADDVVDAALAWVANAPQQFFLWVHFYDPHADYRPPSAYALAFASSPYDGEIAFTDVQLGRLLQAIDARFGKEGTLVAVTSDHGESLGEHGEPAHSYTLYDGTQRVPLLLKGPGLAESLQIDSPVRLVDLAPTLLALVGAAPLDDVDGKDLAPVIAGTERGPRLAYMETLATRLDFGWSPLHALRDDRAKLIRAPRPELYDLKADPKELVNRAVDDPATLARLDGALSERLAAAAPLASPVALAESERLRLESLGYVVPNPSSLGSSFDTTEGPDPKDHVQALTALNRAGALIKKGRPREALAILDAVDEQGSYFVALRASAALEAGDPVRAEREAKIAVAAEERRVDLQVLLARALLQQGRLDESRQSFERAGALDPGAPIVAVGLGQVAEAAGDRERAREHYREAHTRARAQESSSEGGWRLAALMLEMGELEKADQTLASLAPAESKSEDAARRLAAAELVAGRTEAAIARLEDASEAIPDSAGVALLLGSAFEKAGRPDDALAARERAVLLAPDAPAALNDLAWSLAVTGKDLDRALELAERVHAAAPKALEALDTLAVVRLRRGEAAAALVLLEGVPKASDPSSRLDIRRAAALAALGRPGPARAALERALQGAAGRKPDWASEAEALAKQLGVPWPRWAASTGG
jgi:arylsulfatase A-like enzyme/predicted Zn-dependent protease